jgi:hypothetical protein
VTTQIHLASELEALPVGAVLIDDDGDAWQVRDPHDGYNPSPARYVCATGDPRDTAAAAEGLIAVYGPLRVVWQP